METLRYKRLWLMLGIMLIMGMMISSLMPLNLNSGIPHQDKLMHIVGYSVLTLWFLQIIRNQRAIVLIPLGMVLLGITVELMQGLTHYRYPDRMDAIANGIGCLVAALLALTPLRDTLLKLERYLP
jgi:VanZ family protein